MVIDTIWERVFLTDSPIIKFQVVADDFLSLSSPPLQRWGSRSCTTWPFWNGLFQGAECRCSLFSDSWSCISLWPWTILLIQCPCSQCANWWWWEGRNGHPESLSRCPLHLFYLQMCPRPIGDTSAGPDSSGVWTEHYLHFNILEMKAVQLALATFRDWIKGESMVLISDNATVVAYIKNQGSTVSRVACALTKKFLPGQNSLWFISQQGTIQGRRMFSSIILAVWTGCFPPSFLFFPRSSRTYSYVRSLVVLSLISSIQILLRVLISRSLQGCGSSSVLRKDGLPIFLFRCMSLANYPCHGTCLFNLTSDVSQGSGIPSSSCLNVIQWLIQKAGFSRQVADAASPHLERSTACLNQGKWSRFLHKCCGRNFAPRRVNFQWLTELFLYLRKELKLSALTIKGYRLARLSSSCPGWTLWLTILSARWLVVPRGPALLGRLNTRLEPVSGSEEPNSFGN